MSPRARRPGGEPTRRQQAAQETHTRIANAARALFHERGFDAVTTDEIAAAAGVAKGTLFLHAPSKERLLLMVYENELAAVSAQALARVPAELAAAPALARVFSRFFRLYEAAPELARHFVREIQFLPPAAAPRLEAVRLRFMAGLVVLLAQRQRRGRIAADVDLQLAALNSFLIYYGVLTAWLSGHLPDAAARDWMLEQCLALHWRGLEGPAPARRRARRAL